VKVQNSHKAKKRKMGVSCLCRPLNAIIDAAS
jgi:hypothetical protein